MFVSDTLPRPLTRSYLRRIGRFSCFAVCGSPSRINIFQIFSKGRDQSCKAGTCCHSLCPCFESQFFVPSSRFDFVELGFSFEIIHRWRSCSSDYVHVLLIFIGIPVRCEFPELRVYLVVGLLFAWLYFTHSANLVIKFTYLFCFF